MIGVVALHDGGGGTCVSGGAVSPTTMSPDGDVLVITGVESELAVHAAMVRAKATRMASRRTGSSWVFVESTGARCSFDGAVRTMPAMQFDTTAVEEYLDTLPDAHRSPIDHVRATVLANLPTGYEEVMNSGMVTYQVPLETFSDTYNGRPLVYAAIVSRKHHMAIHLMSIYTAAGAAEAFAEAYRASGKRLDMGKACVRFRQIDDLPLELIGRTIASTSVDEFVAAAAGGPRGTR